MAVITRDEFEEWLQHPVTIQLKKRLNTEREEMKEGLLSDNYENPDKVKGICHAIKNFLEVSYEDLYDSE